MNQPSTNATESTLRSMLASWRASEPRELYATYIKQIASHLHKKYDKGVCPECGGALDETREESTMDGEGHNDGGLCWVRDCPECFHQVEIDRASRDTVRRMKAGLEDWPGY